MQYLWTHIEAILTQYDGVLPLTHYLKAYYKKYPILGSRDRRAIADAVFAFYRCGRSLKQDAPLRERVYAAMYLTRSLPKPLAASLPAWWDDSLVILKNRMVQTGLMAHPIDNFPHTVQISGDLLKPYWAWDLLRQRRLFIYARTSSVAEKLSVADIPFEALSDTCLALPNSTKVESILAPDEYWIMDASSQKTGDYFQPQKAETWWDCCAGAGGKSLLLKHLEPSVKLTVSDIRDSILQNLKSRFKQYHLSLPESIVADVSDSAALSKSLAGRSFDAIICDAPCTGSGTWARTPEGAYFFKEESLVMYSSRQKAILAAAATYLRGGGRIIYITCSVFRKENEEVVAYALENTTLSLESSQLINGSSMGADCLYVAVLRKPA